MSPPPTVTFAAHPPVPVTTRGPGGFTLVELVVALTIIGVAFAFSVPLVRNIRAEQQAREPVIELVRMAKEARLRAMREKRPYQVAFHPGGFVASRYLNPYMQLAELTLLLEESETGVRRLNPNADDQKDDLDSGNAVSTTAMPMAPPLPPRDDHWEMHYNLPQGTTYSVKYWHDLQETFIEGEIVRLWVFQPSGLCQPLKLHLERPESAFDVEFGALTADIIRETSEMR